MKINAPVKINISELKANIDPSVKVETIKADLKAEGAHVAGYRDEDGTLVMVISGDIDIETIEAVFDEDAQVDFNEFVIDDIELIDADTVEVFDNKNIKNSMKKSLSEKKKDCCPPAPKKKSVMISLAEAFQRKKVSKKKVSLDNVIDSMAGHKLTESAAINALNKAKNEAIDYYLMEKLGKDKYKLILESLEADKTSIHGNVKVNGKKIEEYTTDELVGLLEKVSRQINTLEEKVGMSLNETDTAKLNKELETKKKIQNILDEEISFREALKAIKEDDNDSNNLDFKDLNPDTVDNDKKDDKSKKDKDKDDDKNPDEDEEVEIGNIIITLDSKKSAEELKNDLIDAGIPEDAIEIEPVEDSDEDEDEEKSDDSEDKENKEDSEEDSEDETPNESVKVKAGKKINEDDSEESDEDKEDDDKDEDKSEDEDSEDEDDEEETGSYKLILADTDYAPQLSDVLQDIWGLSKEEFEEMIGGEIVAADDDEDSSDDKEKKDDSEDKSDDSSDEDDSLEDFDPDEIFKDL